MFLDEIDEAEKSQRSFIVAVSPSYQQVPRVLVLIHLGETKDTEVPYFSRRYGVKASTKVR